MFVYSVTAWGSCIHQYVNCAILNVRVKQLIQQRLFSDLKNKRTSDFLDHRGS